jgi:pantoate--beta-alanine ligase
MRTIRSISTMQRHVKSWRRRGTNIAFVPTMGYLHAGHVSLVERARALAGAKGMVVVSVYVNPTQFGPKEDFSKYPRDFSRDCAICRRAGVDVVFAPSNEEMYSASARAPFSTFVVEERLTRGMEGASRPTHFRGVTTVLAKLFNIVQPGLAIFGAKDYQQAAVVQRMVRDLNFPVKIIVAPTKREADGLAMSSRNKYLSSAERKQAVILWQAIGHAQRLMKSSSKTFSAERLAKELTKLILQQPSARLDYLEFFDSETLEPVQRVTAGTHLAMAVFIGRTRLIDNARL